MLERDRKGILVQIPTRSQPSFLFLPFLVKIGRILRSVEKCPPFVNPLLSSGPTVRTVVRRGTGDVKGVADPVRPHTVPSSGCTTVEFVSEEGVGRPVGPESRESCGVPRATRQDMPGTNRSKTHRREGRGRDVRQKRQRSGNGEKEAPGNLHEQGPEVPLLEVQEKGHK